MKNITFYTDGSSSGMRKGGNPIAGWSAVIPDLNGKQYIRYGHIPKGTNNEGELTGPYFILKKFHMLKDLNIEIISDSQYFIKSVTLWRKKWEYTCYDGIKNQQILIPIFDLYDKHKNTKLTWIRGHEGNEGNELADLWAGNGKRQIIKNEKTDLVDIEFVPHAQFEFYLGR